LPAYDRLRPLFKKTTSGWTPVPWTADGKDGAIKAEDSAPEKKSWYIFDGGIKAPIESQWIKSHFMAERGYYSVPVSGTPRYKAWASLYTGWEIYEPVFRPVLVTEKPAGDPDGWKISDKHLDSTACVKAFRKLRAGKSFDLQIAPGKTVRRTFESLGSNEIKIDWQFESSKGAVLLEIGPADKMYSKDNGDEAIGAFEYQTCLVTNGKWRQVEFVGVPVAAADLDGDGRSEWLSSLDGYNAAGYALLDSDFRELARYYWGFH